MRITILGRQSVHRAKVWCQNNLGPPGERWDSYTRQMGNCEFKFFSESDATWFALVNTSK